VKILPPSTTGPLAGKSFCFTGELSAMKRPDAEALVRSLGGQTKPSVTKGLSYLVTNDPSSGSEKNKKAVSYGVAIIDEAAFLALAGKT
jgi:DNA ligase (NAD+)